jgi:hypothetical protein
VGWWTGPVRVPGRLCAYGLLLLCQQLGQAMRLGVLLQAAQHACGCSPAGGSFTTQVSLQAYHSAMCARRTHCVCICASGWLHTASEQHAEQADVITDVALVAAAAPPLLLGATVVQVHNNLFAICSSKPLPVSRYLQSLFHA